MTKLKKRGNRAIPEETEKLIIAAIKEEYTQHSIAEEYGVSRATVARISRKLKKGA